MKNNKKLIFIMFYLFLTGTPLLQCFGQMATFSIADFFLFLWLAFYEIKLLYKLYHYKTFAVSVSNTEKQQFSAIQKLLRVLLSDKDRDNIHL